MSDEADRRRTYAELEKRGQRTPGKYFGPSTPSLPIKKTPKIKVIDMSKMKQLKLLKTGGNVDPLKGIGKIITDLEKGKTGIKTVDRQKRKDAALTKNLKKLAKRTKVRAKPQTLDITPKPGGAFSIQKETITMAKDGGLMEAIKKVKAKEMQEGGPTSDADREMMMMILGEKGAAMSDADRAMLRRIMGRTGVGITDADRQRANRMMGIATRMESGGAVPAKFKGFSKLPEDVQEKMNPTLAKKFEKGGPVKMGSGGGVCRGMGAARASGKFKLR